MTKTLGVLKTTAIGGIIFLLPLVVIGVLLGQAAQVVLVIVEVLEGWIPVRTVGGVSLIAAVALLTLVLACFVSGLAAQRSFGKWISQTVEKNLLLLFPRYAIFKAQVQGSLGGDEAKPRLKPVLVRFDDVSRIAFEVERDDTGLVTVYLPGSPDPWSGHTACMTADRVEPLEMRFSDAVTSCEQLGRNPVSKSQSL